ncbi:alanyl-tRNA editing protein [Thalassovita aquimarina]|uniref:Alanine--tRNA ligase n=1 Tax=Thalassovita aquimarina TaxID=2785917 RepID=A0ABS5HME6_9RHOB|nr:alanyl-tRNA editing protein [Thalassovita aquimarina]MBR9649723.1 alanyl-tRNA editing protein [Thalassovita aquimarina]
MTRPLFREDAYMRSAKGVVTGHTPEGGIVLDQSIFYAKGGGQPGDSGKISWPGGEMTIATTVKGDGDDIVLVPAEPGAMPAPGTEVEQQLDWDRRHRHMRVHTALHLLSVVLPFPVSGGSIGAEKGRLDFDMPEAPEDRDLIAAALNEMVDRDLPVTEDWISDEELQANPGLVKTMSVMPPMGQGKVRLVRIGQGADQVDLQPCGGTHVARTGEIGRLVLGKIEKKGKQNRRVSILLDD